MAAWKHLLSGLLNPRSILHDRTATAQFNTPAKAEHARVVGSVKLLCIVFINGSKVSLWLTCAAIVIERQSNRTKKQATILFSLAHT